MESIENNSNTNLNISKDSSVYLSVVGATIVIICFFLPWIEIDCFGKKTLSGADIGGILISVPIGAAIFIFAFYSFYKRNEIVKILLVGGLNTIFTTIILAYKYFSFTENLKKELGWSPDKLGITLKYGAVLTIIGEVLILIGCGFMIEKVTSGKSPVMQDSTDTISKLEKLGKLKEQNIITEDEFINQKSAVLNTQKTNFDSKVFSFDFVDFFNRADIWYKRNMKTILFLCGAIVFSLFIFIFFIRNDPTKDGKKAANNYCDCAEEYSEDLSKTKEGFLNNFDSYNFQNRGEARKKIDEIASPIIKTFQECNERASIKYDSYKNKYTKDKNNLKLFTTSFSENNLNCGLTSMGDLPINKKVSARINTLKELEPEQEKIKNDLIGNKIPGWKFDYLSEFKKFEILRIEKNNETLKYLIKLELLGDSSTSIHEAEIKVTYLISDEGWYFDSVSLNYITYDNEFHVDKWIKIVPLKDSRLTFNIDKKFVLKTNEYSEEYNFGPDSEERTIPYSTMYLGKSREEKTIIVRFKYTFNK